LFTLFLYLLWNFKCCGLTHADPGEVGARRNPYRKLVGLGQDMNKLTKKQKRERMSKTAAQNLKFFEVWFFNFVVYLESVREGGNRNLLPCYCRLKNSCDMAEKRKRLDWKNKETKKQKKEKRKKRKMFFKNISFGNQMNTKKKHILQTKTFAKRNHWI